jgi:hypothetical protein
MMGSASTVDEGTGVEWVTKAGTGVFGGKSRFNNDEGAKKDVTSMVAETKVST